MGHVGWLGYVGAGVGWSCRDGVGHAWWGGSCRGGICHAGVRCIM